MSDDVQRIGFEVALAELKKGGAIARVSWGNYIRQQKTKVALSPYGGIRTWYLNYYSDRGVITTDDILADDWVVVELAPPPPIKPDKERGE